MGLLLVPGPQPSATLPANLKTLGASAAGYFHPLNHNRIHDDGHYAKTSCRTAVKDTRKRVRSGRFEVQAGQGITSRVRTG